uniref:Lipoprotein n=1 Tax=Psychrobacter sp. (strain PRwf-1) TaxID=349106 RepID=A5WBX7_PSYWF
MPKLTFNALLASSALLGTLVLTGCASTGNVTPQYIPPSTYQNYDCASLSQEYNRINSYINNEKSSASGITTTGVGVGVSAGRWGISPNINIGLGKSNNNAARDAKLSRLYGESDAVVQSARIKNCAFAAKLKVYGE